MLPAHAPFSESARRLIETALVGLDATQRAWLSGYLASAPAAAVTAPAASVKALVLYGTESGNSEKLADRTAKEAKKKGIAATVKNMSDIKAADLAKHQNLMVVVSTWGDGEPPDTATGFYKEFMALETKLPDLKFSVCALGDTSYEKFCQVGKDIDAKLESLGAQRVAPRADCDVDYEEAFTDWLGATLTALAPQSVAVAEVPAAALPVASSYGLKNPFPSEVLENILLNGKGSAKETIHVELSLAGSGLTYEPGDALAVIPSNADDVVADLLQAAKLTGKEEIETKATGKKALADALREDLDITGLSRSVLTKLQEAAPHPKLAALLDESAKEQLKEYTYGREIVDAIVDFAPQGLPAQTLASLLRKLPPRLYSIASSPLAHPDEVHLTVAAVRYQSHGRARKGVASTYLADKAHTGQSVKVYTHTNKNFRLPENGDTPIIMVGPGTGIAPFRAFVEHRAELGHSGKNWLFFGDQRYMFDFLYQLEWQEHLKNGTLSRLDVAFSRDQPEKIYVQQRMREKSRDLYDWLQQGAHFYVCGDASRMANDVHEALIDIYQQHGGLTREAAEAELEALKKAKRYQRDVY
ncbi:MAG: sulfite reductase [NADPH] flavoprotein alpha-component [Verrucomicrobia bacterium]|nr:MAG: sulfite reductase [NADPH] flavoprotein alpha-component [Verrucomicrobiota bacterium]